MKHKCDNCEHKYTNNSGSGICLMYNSYEQACEAYNAETCPYAEPKMTNFDRIKAMSVEELARLLMSANDGDFIVGICNSAYCEECIDGVVTCSGNCEKAIIKYLESEVDAV